MGWRFLRTIILCAAFAGLAAGYFPARAETGKVQAKTAQAKQAESDSVSIAVVDVEKILSDSKAARSLQKQIQDKKDIFQREFSEKENSLKATETQLIGSRERLSAEEFAQQRKAYEEEIFEVRKLFQQRRNALDKGLGNAMQDLRRSIVEAAARVAEQKDYDVVLTRESVLIVEKRLDITQDVLNALDASVSDIPLKVE
ncbi:MAG: OmpH family outer membrane protein [Micavibrio sp.]